MEAETKIIKLLSRDGYFHELIPISEKEYVLKTPYSVRISDEYLDPSGGPMIRVGSEIPGIPGKVKRFEFQKALIIEFE